jgi:ABC-type antimicrobial peptide transport system permease subunit
MFRILTFILLLFIYLLAQLVNFVGKFMPRWLVKKPGAVLNSIYGFLIKRLDDNKGESISRIELIDISLANMKSKKVRTLVTIGGMAIGIGAIVFLVSIGYGLQGLVVSRVVRLEEMRQADVFAQAGSKLKLNDKILEKFKRISEVDEALPMISVVGKVHYKKAVSDMAVYGVTTDYLKNSAVRPVRGDIYNSNELVVDSQPEGKVAGVQDVKDIPEFKESLGQVEFEIYPNKWLKVRKEPTIDAEILGYTKRAEGVQTGIQVWGGSYKDEDGNGTAGTDINGRTLGKWIKVYVYIWEYKHGNYTQIFDENGNPIQSTGYVGQVNMQAQPFKIEQGKVLGESTESTTSAENVDWVEIASESAEANQSEINIVEPTDDIKQEAVVNQAMLDVLGMKPEDAVGNEFDVEFSVVGKLTEKEEKIKSALLTYTISGVIPGEQTPMFYVPFIDLRSLGVNNFTQAKIVAQNKEVLKNARDKIESMGFVTASVADTVAQINNIFRSVRLALGVLGMVALAVASLGMFNTLTVSLLERTQEVGLMKALGMRSSEVKELFLTESMIMGFLGGVFGIFVGWLGGKLLGVGLSVFSVIKGVGVISVSSIPAIFVGLIVVLALLVGIGTGFYPAKRATKISALNALRYE